MRSLLLLFLASLSPPAALAWWCTGHMLVAQVAHNELVSSHPVALSEAIRYLDVLRSFTREAAPFIEGACWPDTIKGVGYEAQNDQHFVNIPILQQGYTPDRIRDSNPNNITEAIKDYNATLHSRDTSAIITDELTNSLALRFLIHFVGDLHQPLHASELYSPSFPSGDRGGNFFSVSTDWNPHISNLHKFWDSGAGQHPEFDLPLSDGSQRALAKMADAIRENWPRSAFSEELSHPDSQEWAEESVAIAERHVYKGVQEHTELKKDDVYVKKAVEVVERQIALGGYRLADLLASALEREAPSTDKTSDL